MSADPNSIDSIFEEIVKTAKDKYDKMPRHGFKKGQWLWEYNVKYKMTSLVRVVKCSPTAMALESLDYKDAIPYRAEGDFTNYRPVTANEKRQIRIQKIMGPVTNKIMDGLLFVQTKLNLKHTHSPQNLKDYAANWLAFFITVAARCHSYVYDPSSKNTFKFMAAHGPLWKGHDYKEKYNEF